MLVLIMPLQMVEKIACYMACSTENIVVNHQTINHLNTQT